MDSPAKQRRKHSAPRLHQHQSNTYFLRVALFCGRIVRKWMILFWKR